MIKGVIFDVDGTLVDSVDLHARAWQEAFAAFGHEIPFQAIRDQIGKGGDQLLPALLSDDAEKSKPHPDIFEAGLRTIGVLCAVRRFAAGPRQLGPPPRRLPTVR